MNDRAEEFDKLKQELFDLGYEAIVCQTCGHVVAYVKTSDIPTIRDAEPNTLN